MKKEYLFGGLAIVGAIALVAYLRKPKRNEDGFFGATGGRMGSASTSRQKRCTVLRKDGTSWSYPAYNGNCNRYGGTLSN